jgi:ribosomal-protein-alanine N-acetyltransferase
MQEALQAAVDYGFGTLGLHSIEANTDPENIASQRVLERTGFVREGHVRENHFFEGRFYDTVIYSMLAPAKNGQ